MTRILSVLGARPMDPELISDRVAQMLADGRPSGQVSTLWDGRAASRIVEVLEKELAL